MTKTCSIFTIPTCFNMAQSQKRKTPPFPNTVANGNKSGIIATVGLLSIILARNIDKCAHRTKKKQKKRKTFLNFFTKTCTVFLYGVVEYLKNFQQTTRSLRNYVPKHFEIGQTTRSVEHPWGDHNPPPPTKFFFDPPMSRGYKKLHFITFLTSFCVLELVDVVKSLIFWVWGNLRHFMGVGSCWNMSLFLFLVRERNIIGYFKCWNVVFMKE